MLEDIYKSMDNSFQSEECITIDEYFNFLDQDDSGDLSLVFILYYGMFIYHD